MTPATVTRRVDENTELEEIMVELTSVHGAAPHTVGRVTVGVEYTPSRRFQKAGLSVVVELPATVEDILSGLAVDTAHALAEERLRTYFGAFYQEFVDFSNEAD